MFSADSIQGMGHYVKRKVPKISAAICYFLGILDFIALMPIGLRAHIGSEFAVVPGVFENAVAASAASAALLLWFIAGGLARQQKRAWQIAMFLLTLSFSLRLWTAQDLHTRALAPLIINTGLLMLLWWGRTEFHAVSAPISGLRLKLAVIALFTISMLTGFAFISIRAHAIHVNQPISTRLSEVLQGLVGFPTPLDIEDSRSADLVYYSLLGLGLTLGLIILYLLLRAPFETVMHTRNSSERLNQLLKSGDTSDSLGYFALRPEKGILWSEDHRACISYSVIQGVMMASGDPIGDFSAWPELMEKFGTHSRTHSWIPAVAGCSDLSARTWQNSLGLSTFEIGDEAVVNTQEFTQHGRPMKNVRNAVTRANRANLVFHLQQVSQFSNMHAQELRSLADQWRQGDRERGHSMALGRVCHEDDPEAVIAWATLNGEIQGFLQFVPWGIKDWSLDLMRRDRSAPSGIMEFLIVNSIEHAMHTGVEKISLNFAPFRRLYTESKSDSASSVSYPAQAVAMLAAHFSQAQSLTKFSQKFQPEWQPRFLLYPSALSFVRVASAYLRAEAFLPRPRNWATPLSPTR